MLVVGAASRDLAPDDARGWRLGGAVSFGALALARLGVPTRALIGADAQAADADELDVLRHAGVDVSVARLASGPVFRNVELASGRRQRCLSISSALAPRRLPERWAIDADAMCLAPVAGELDDEWALVPAAGAFVSLGWQGLLRTLAAGHDVERVAPVARPLVTRANLLGVSENDLGPEVRLSRLVDLVSVGASVLVTRGDRGGSLLTSRRPARSGLRAYPAIPSNRVVDPTGAGDVFLAALVATIVDGARLGIGGAWPERLTFAAAAASLAVEGPGLAGVPGLEAVRRRVAEVA